MKEKLSFQTVFPFFEMLTTQKNLLQHTINSSHYIRVRFCLVNFDTVSGRLPLRIARYNRLPNIERPAPSRRKKLREYLLK